MTASTLGELTRGVDFEKVETKQDEFAGKTALSVMQMAGAQQAIANSQQDEAVWELRTNVLEPSTGAGQSTVKGRHVPGVQGAVLIPNVLSQAECDALINLTEEKMGYSCGLTTVSVPRELRNNDACVFVAPAPLLEELSRRLAASLPAAGAEDAVRCDPAFVNARFRCYRYERPDQEGAVAAEGQRFGPHYDGAQGRSAVRDGLLLEDSTGGVQRSQMSVLLYLNGGHAGGETIFYPGGDASDLESAVPVAPEAGHALVFWHGEHPLSPLHEGAPLRPAGAGEAGPRYKYVIRSDILFCSPHRKAEETLSFNGIGSPMAAAIHRAYGGQAPSAQAPPPAPTVPPQPSSWPAAPAPAAGQLPPDSPYIAMSPMAAAMHAAQTMKWPEPPPSFCAPGPPAASPGTNAGPPPPSGAGPALPQPRHGGGAPAGPPPASWGGDEGEEGELVAGVEALYRLSGYNQELMCAGDSAECTEETGVQALVYGEVLSPLKLFRAMGLGPRDALFDLGSGRGQVVLAAAMWRRQGGAGEAGAAASAPRMVGVELVRARHEAAAAAAVVAGPLRHAVEFRCEDALTTDLSHASAIFLNNTAFPPALNASFAASLTPARTPALRVLATCAPLPKPLLGPAQNDLALTAITAVKAGWAPSGTPVFIYHRGQAAAGTPPVQVDEDAKQMMANRMETARNMAGDGASTSTHEGGTGQTNSMLRGALITAMIQEQAGS